MGAFHYAKASGNRSEVKWRLSTYFGRNIPTNRLSSLLKGTRKRNKKMVRDILFGWIMSFHFPQVFPALVSDRVWRNGKYLMTELMSMAQFTSWVFRVFMLTIKNKNEE